MHILVLGAGTFNATGPAVPLTLGSLLERIASALNVRLREVGEAREGEAKLTWVSEAAWNAVSRSSSSA